MLRHLNTQSIENVVNYTTTMLLVFLTIMITIIYLLLVTKNSENQCSINMKKKNDDYNTKQYDENNSNANHISILVSYI